MDNCKLCLFLALTLVLLIKETSSAGTEWNHDKTDTARGPLHWGENYEKCKGSKQSPIHIWSSSSDTTYDSTVTGEFEFGNYNSSALKLKLKNTGHGPRVDLGDEKMYIKGGGLAGGAEQKYTLQQFHIHSGNASSRGSEHLSDVGDFSAEIHLVFFKDGVNPENILETENGLAVLGVLLKSGGAKNAEYDKLLTHFPSIVQYDSSVDILPTFNPWELLPSEVGHFFRYQGSLTTPPCSEVVQWTVFRTPVYLSDDQIHQFTTLSYGQHDIVNTYREVMPLNDRTVYRSWGPPEEIAAIAGGVRGLYTGSTLAVLTSILLLLLQ